MNRNKVNLTIDVLALVLFALVLFTGFAMGAFHGAPQGTLLWGMGKFVWVRVHEMGSYLLFAAMVGHLLLHSYWIRVMFCGGPGASPVRRRIGGILMVCAALLLVASIVAPRMIQRPAAGAVSRPEGFGSGAHHH